MYEDSGKLDLGYVCNRELMEFDEGFNLECERKGDFKNDSDFYPRH